MGFVLPALDQIKAENGSHVECTLAPVIRSGHALKQSEDDMRKVEKNLWKCVIDQLIQIVIGMALEDKIEVFRRSFKLHSLHGDEVHGMLE